MSNQNKDFKELDIYYKNLGYKCPKCNNTDNVIPCVFGRPSAQLLEYAQEGHVKLMGCCLEPNEENKFLKAICKKCDSEIYG